MSILVALLALQVAAAHQTTSVPDACQNAASASCDDGGEDSEIMMALQIEARASERQPGEESKDEDANKEEEDANKEEEDKEDANEEEKDANKEEDEDANEEEEDGDEEEELNNENKDSADNKEEEDNEESDEDTDQDKGFELTIEEEGGSWRKIKAWMETLAKKIGVHSTEINPKDLEFSDKDGNKMKGCKIDLGEHKCGDLTFPITLKYTYKKAELCSQEQKQKPIYISGFECKKNTQKLGPNQKYEYAGDTPDGRPYYKSKKMKNWATMYLYYDRAAACINGAKWILAPFWKKTPDFTKKELLFDTCRITASFSTSSQCAPTGKQRMQWQWCGMSPHKEKGYWMKHYVTLSDTESNAEEENEETEDQGKSKGKKGGAGKKDKKEDDKE